MFARGLFSARALGGVAAVAAASGAALFYNAQTRVAESAAATSSAVLNPKEYLPFKLKEVQEISPNTKLFRFELPAGIPLGLKTASMVMTKATVNGEDVERPYTPTTLGDVPGYFDFVIKKYPTGKMSGHIHNLKPGDTLLVKGPIQKFKYEPNAKTHIGMIAGGTGITPMYQVIQEVLRNPNDKTKVTLIFANIAAEDILLKKELDALAAKHSNFKVHYVLERPPQGWTGSTGYVSEATIKTHMPAPSEGSGIVFVCGPPPMMEAISGNKNMKDYSQGELKGLLKKLDYKPEGVFKF